jgi:hypothetical protein
MNDSDIKQFIDAFDDFLKHAEEEIDSYLKWQEARVYTNEFYKQKAAEYKVSVDYYLAEFV